MNNHNNDDSSSERPLKQQIYQDSLHPAAVEIGKLIGRFPRLINAALSGLDCWIENREYNIAIAKKTLEQKLSCIESDKIVAPEPYIAIPAIQSLSYSMNNEELRNLYVNLLAQAMTIDTKDKVHPAFIEIIKQMSPNDAVTLTEISMRNSALPIAQLSIVMKHKGMHLVSQPPETKTCLDYVSDIHPLSLTEKQVNVSIDNLKRLGLVLLSEIELSGLSTYDYVQQSVLYSEMKNEFTLLNQSEDVADSIHTHKLCLTLSPIGKLFCEVCIKGFE